MPILDFDLIESLFGINSRLVPSFYIDFDFFKYALSSDSGRSGTRADLKLLEYEFCLKLGEQVISRTAFSF
jgi:hypothetical protein